MGQPFSGAGWQAGFQDLRGSIIFSIVEFMTEVQPKAALLENVGNFVTHDAGKTIEKVRDVLNSIGYHVQWTKCDAANILPQMRQRTYITAIRWDVYVAVCDVG